MNIADYVRKNFGGNGNGGRTGDNRNPTGHGDYYQRDSREIPAIDFKSVSLLSIDLVVTGTYRQEFLRPYMVSTTRNDLNAIADYAVDNNGNVAGSMLAGLAGRVLNYSNKVNERDVVDIENGFDTQRFSFIINVVEREFDDFNVEQEIVTEISGYTDRIDAALKTRATRGTSGNDQEILLAGDTMFYITNISKVNKTNALVMANNQIITPSYYRGNNMNGRHDSLYIARPKDVFTNEGVNATIAGERYGTNININQASKLIGTVPKPSRYTNLTPASYLSSAINALSSAETIRTSTDQYGSVGSNYSGKPARDVVMRSAAGYLKENTGFEANTFMTVLRDEVSGFGRNNVFRWKDLHQVFGYNEIENITQVHNFDSDYSADARMSNINQDIADHSDSENGGRNAVMFTVMRQAIPGLAFQHGIQGCVIQATNALDNSSRMDSHQGILVNVYDVIWTHKFTDQEQERRTRNMERDIAIMVLLDASINNSFQFDIAIDLEWRFDSFYRIGIDGGRMLEFTTAGFAGALSSPVVTTSLDLTETLGRDLRAIVDTALGR